MAVVMPVSEINRFLNDRIILENGEITKVMRDNVAHITFAKYPPQGTITTDVYAIFIEKPFVDFVKVNGGKNITAEGIMAQYSEIPVEVASSIAWDFSVSYNNYSIMPTTVCIASTVGDVGSDGIFAIINNEAQALTEAELNELLT